MTRSSAPTRIGHLSWRHSDHLANTLDDIERLATTVSGAVDLGSTAPELWDLAVIASCRLDGAAMTSTPPDGDVHELVTEDSTREEVWRREYAGVQAALQADDLAHLLRRDVLRGLQHLHHELTRGLVAHDDSGRLRRTEQAVHDGREGRIVFRPVAASEIAAQLPFLQVLTADREHHPVVVAGLVQFDLLRLHPFESANGRLARTAARLLLREAGLDPGGLAVAEIPMSARRVGNYDQVAAALRSGDLTRMLEAWAEDVAAGLRLAVTWLGLEPFEVAEADLLDELGTTFTLVDLQHAMADEHGSDVALAEARRAASRLADAGLVAVQPGRRGLRLARTGDRLPAWSSA